MTPTRDLLHQKMGSMGLASPLLRKKMNHLNHYHKDRGIKRLRMFPYPKKRPSANVSSHEFCGKTLPADWLDGIVYEKVEELKLEHCHVKSLDFLSAYPNIVKLSIVCCGWLEDLVSVSHCPRLSILCVSTTDIRSFVGIEYLGDLEELTLVYCSLNNLQAISGIGIKELSIRFCKFEALPSDLPKLKKLECPQNTMERVPFYPSLEILYCHLNLLSDLDEYNGSSLKILNCNENHMTGLPFLPCIQKLECHANTIGSLAGLTDGPLGCQDSVLEELVCSANRLITLTGLEKCHNLRRLTAYNNDIFDATALEGKRKLRHVNLRGNMLLVPLGLNNDGVVESFTAKKRKSVRWTYDEMGIDCSKNPWEDEFRERS